MGLLTRADARKPIFADPDCALREPKSEVLLGQHGVGPAVAQRLVDEFCEAVPATRVAPSQQELEDFWARCALQNPSTIASAVSQQLANAIGAHAWQPQLRVLCVLAFLQRQGDAGRAVVSAVLTEVSDLVKHVASEVPECRVEASRLLCAWRAGLQVDVSPSASVSDMGCPSDSASAAAPAEEEERGRAQALSAAEELGVATTWLGATEESRQATLAAAPEIADLLGLTTPGSTLPQASASNYEAHPMTSRENVLAEGLEELEGAVWDKDLPVLRPERFDIARGEEGSESKELNRMFSFQPMASQESTVPLVTDEYISRHHHPKTPDPFAFVAEHMTAA